MQLLILATKQELIGFYSSRGLSPDNTYGMPQATYKSLASDASDVSKSFGLFFKNSLLAVEQNRYEMVFKSWEELYDCYCSFMDGYIGNKS